MRLLLEPWNPENVKRNTIVQIAIVTVAFVLLARIWPCGLVERHIYSRQGAFNPSGREGLAGEPFSSVDKKLQTVFFQKPHLKHVTLYMDCSTADSASAVKAKEETILFRIYDDSFSGIYEEEVSCGLIERNGYLEATPDLEVETDRAYYYEILVPEGCSAQIKLPIAARGALGQHENGALYIDGVINDEACLIADFDYTQPLSAFRIIVYDGLILAGAAVLYLLLMLGMGWYGAYFGDRGETIGRYARIAASVLAGTAALALFVFSVVLNKFGGELWDRLFFTVGIAAGAAWALTGIWASVLYPKQDRPLTVPVRAKHSLMWRNYLQTVSFALLFYALCQYVNADRNLHHWVNTRWMLIFFAIALLMNYSEKLLLTLPNGAWLVAAAVGSALYCRGLEGDTFTVARLTCGVIVAWGLLALTILSFLIRQSAASVLARGTDIQNIKTSVIDFAIKNKVQLIYIVVWVLFSLLMYKYRFEKVWVYTATLPFLALFFTKNTDAFKSRFLKNATNGILLSFGLVVYFCLAHRPYHYWMLYRYSGLFHTVACTGMYLAMVFGAALAKLLGKLKKKKRLFLSCPSEYFMLAATASFIILSMSRTAFLTMGVTFVAVAALAAVTYRKGAARIARELGVLAAACIVSFPMVYTVVRMVPAVVNDPVRYDVEFQDRSFMVYEGDPIDSGKYMTVRRFFATFFGRLQNQEEEGAGAAANPRQGQVLTVREAALLAYNSQGFAGTQKMAVSDEAEDRDGGGGGENRVDISNGRFKIFESYLEATELKGHPEMEPETVSSGHAHNSYLQVAYNFGMIAGVLFLALCALALWRAILLFYGQGRQFGIFLAPFALIVVFGLESLTEWAFHPCIPAGFGFILMQVFLMRKN